MAVLAGKLEGDVCVFAMREYTSLSGGTATHWDWRNFAEVGRVKFEATFEQLVPVPLRVPVPVLPGQTRLFYIFCHSTRDEPRGPAARKPRKVAYATSPDGTVQLHRVMGNCLLPFVSFLPPRDGKQMRLLVQVNVAPVGGIRYRVIDDARYAKADARLQGTRFSLAMKDRYDLVGVGTANRYLINEWSGKMEDPPKFQLLLPSITGSESTGRRRSFSTVTAKQSVALGWKPSVSEIDELWLGNAACREMWQVWQCPPATLTATGL